MTQSETATRTHEQAQSRQPSGAGPASGHPGQAQLDNDSGKTRISGGVVAKIAGLAAREIPGVQAMGAASSRRLGQLRGLVPGGADATRQGVSAEVGEHEAAIDLDIVTWYGQSIVDVSDAVRRNVIDRVQGMTGLDVVEVNINVDDVFVEGDGGGAATVDGRGGDGRADGRGGGGEEREQESQGAW